MGARRSRLLLVAAVLLAAQAAPREAAAQVGKRDGIVYPSLAGREELLELPHVTPAVADAIVQGRPYLDMAALDRMLAEHLGAEARQALYRRLFVPIDLNKATRAEILLVPGVGPRLARGFEEQRPYRGLADFRRGIGKYVSAAEIARLERFVFVPIDLNGATDEEILSIPGVGRRMLHEFKEYRPYRGIEQFRREIGKYVSREEVARLERYVEIR